MRELPRVALSFLIASPFLAGLVGFALGQGVLHPQNLNPPRLQETAAMLQRTDAAKEDFQVRASDGAELVGWKVKPAQPNGDWVVLFHGVSDNRTGTLGHAEFLLRHNYSLVMMDSRAHGESGGAMCTYGWKERYDTVSTVDALYATEHVRHLYALGVSMGAAIALQSAAVEPRIEAVAAEASFANLREVTYDYAGLEISPALGKTLFRPASMMAMHEAEKEGGFNVDDVSPEKAVEARPFPVLLICGTNDRRIPCRHSQRIFNAAKGPKEIWKVQGAGHAAALGTAPAEYENRVVNFFEKCPASSGGGSAQTTLMTRITRSSSCVPPREN